MVRLQEPCCSIGVVASELLVFFRPKIVYPDNCGPIDIGPVVHPFLISVTRSVVNEDELLARPLRELIVDRNPPLRVAVVDVIPGFEWADFGQQTLAMGGVYAEPEKEVHCAEQQHQAAQLDPRETPGNPETVQFLEADDRNQNK